MDSKRAVSVIFAEISLHAFYSCLKLSRIVGICIRPQFTLGAAPDFRRDQSVLDGIEVDFRLALGGFAERDDADFMVVLCVYI